ncbi:MAG: hypothetical protein C0P61_004795 [Bacillota bacterium]|nr:hypothetical protein [Bacillota bacterium]REJ34095.1 MAG: hypothetical protein DIU84_08140 [Bacillota bacterium]
MWKTVLAVTLLLVSLVTAMVVVQIIGLWDWAGPLWARIAALPAVAPHVERYQLGEEKAALLAAREQELADRAAWLDAEMAALEEQRRQLEAQREELERQRRELVRLQEQLAVREAALRELEDAAVARERLRAVYEAMRPQEAARILLDLTDEEISLLLVGMSPRQAGQILAALPPDRAAQVSRRLGL